MATLNINGQNVSVDDGFLKLPHDQQQTTVDEIAASLKPSPSVGMGEDAAKAIGSGLGSATIGALGSVGDLRSLASSVVPSAVQTAANAASYVLPGGRLIATAPTSEDIKSTVKDPIVSPDYEPQYAFNRVLKKGAEFAPAALAGGPEGIAGKLLTNVALPAVASEVGKQVAGPYGELAGALAGGVGGTAAVRKFQEMAAARKAASALPTGEELLKAGSSGFEAVKASDAIIKPSTVEQMAKDIKTQLLNEGKHPTSEGQVGIFNALDRLGQMGQAPGGVTTKDMEIIRKNLSDLKTSPNPSAANAARMATDAFMEQYASLGPKDLLHGQNPFPTLKEAIGNWAAGKRSATVTGKVDLANLNAGTAGSGANIDNNMRQAIKQLARPSNNTNIPVARKLGFNNEEVAAITRAATGTPAGNTARYLGKYAPTGIVSAAGGAGLGHLVGGPAGAAIPVVGYMAKKIGDLSTKRAVSAVDSLVRSRSPLAAQVATQLPPQIVSQLPAKTRRLLRSLILADPTLSQLSQQSSQPVGQSAAY